MPKIEINLICMNLDQSNRNERQIIVDWARESQEFTRKLCPSHRKKNSRSNPEAFVMN